MDLFNKQFFFCIFSLLVLVVNCQNRPVKDPNRGALIGKLKTLSHDVQGTVWAVDEDTLYIENFHYDGLGPDAFFWVGNDSQPSPRGYLVPYPVNAPDKKPEVLPRFINQNIIVNLPAGLKILDFKWISVWCRRFTVDFGHVLIPAYLDPPRKRVLPEFKRLAHEVRSGNITILDAKTFYIPNLHYDGTAPDAYFWVGRGNLPNQSGKKVPNEMGSYEVLRSYDGEDIEIQLPDNLTVFDIDYLAIWCVEYKHNFGHVLIPPSNELWIPPALGQTKVTPQTLLPLEYENCMQINSNYQVEWRAGENEVEIKLSAGILEDQYMAFGISADQTNPTMVGSDVVIAFAENEDGPFRAVDYTISSRSQCDGTYGVCPDSKVNARNDVKVIRGNRKNGITSIVYSRPYDTRDPKDIIIDKNNNNILVVAAIGQLNSRKEANYHNEFVAKVPIFINFKAFGMNTCTSNLPEKKPEKYEPWPANILRDVNNFTAAIGPTGGDRGYKYITGNPSWGISWWINGMLIPEIYVERGQTYNFVIEGGNDLENPANYHPFYITNSSQGGFSQKTLEEQKAEKVFAGVKYSQKGIPFPTALGRSCQWKHRGPDSWKMSKKFKDYQKTLHRVCAPGKPGSLEWTVGADTPSMVYYQCYTHRHMGWKIHVHDPGFNLPRGAASNLSEGTFFWLLLLLSISTLNIFR